MQQLATYIRSIHQHPVAVQVIDQHTKHSRYTDQGIEVETSVSCYHFDNGVIVRCTTEQDSEADRDALLSCEECWISYELVESAGLEISPRQKGFHNACQQAFWLKTLAMREPD